MGEYSKRSGQGFDGGGGGARLAGVDDGGVAARAQSSEMLAWAVAEGDELVPGCVEARGGPGQVSRQATPEGVTLRIWNFDLNGDALKADHKVALEALGAEVAGAVVEVEGHASAVGPERVNARVAAARADVVAAALRPYTTDLTTRAVGAREASGGGAADSARDRAVVVRVRFASPGPAQSVPVEGGPAIHDRSTLPRPMPPPPARFMNAIIQSDPLFEHAFEAALFVAATKAFAGEVMPGLGSPGPKLKLLELGLAGVVRLQDGSGELESRLWEEGWRGIERALRDQGLGFDTWYRVVDTEGKVRGTLVAEILGGARLGRNNGRLRALDDTVRVRWEQRQ
jgi:outer membrane protein OmpA-like peptidoglycan-associated protein